MKDIEVDVNYYVNFPKEVLEIYDQLSKEEIEFCIAMSDETRKKAYIKKLTQEHAERIAKELAEELNKRLT